MRLVTMCCYRLDSLINITACRKANIAYIYIYIHTAIIFLFCFKKMPYLWCNTVRNHGVWNNTGCSLISLILVSLNAVGM